MAIVGSGFAKPKSCSNLLLFLQSVSIDVSAAAGRPHDFGPGCTVKTRFLPWENLLGLVAKLHIVFDFVLIPVDPKL